ncbi:Lipoprotein LipO precursor [compost metagenome]
MQKRTNTLLDVQMVPGSGQEYANKYSVLASTGDLPDISKTNGFDFQKYADSGVYMEISDLLEKYGPNLKSKISKEAWDLMRYKGKVFAIPYENKSGKIVPIIRADWLEALGLKQPTTLEEYKDVVTKFTFNDPDKNGKQDTYGIGAGAAAWETDFMMIFGAFGAFPFQHEIKDNKVYPHSVSPEYKQAIEYIKGLWDAKVIDPDFFVIKSDAAQQKIAQGKIGTFEAWWSIAPQVLVRNLKMKEIVPNAKLEPFTQLVKGPDGKASMLSMGKIGGSAQISSKAKNPAAAIQFLDYLATEEGWELSLYGLKGVHYNTVEEGLLPEGLKASNEKWLDPLALISFRNDLYIDAASKGKSPEQVEDYRYMKVGLEYPLFQDAFYGLPQTDEQKTYESDLNKYERDMFIKFVTGRESLNNWDAYVNEWKKKGGQKILESRIAKYNELNGTNLASGL